MTPIILLASLSITAVVLVIVLVVRASRLPADDPIEHGDGE